MLDALKDVLYVSVSCNKQPLTEGPDDPRAASSAETAPRGPQAQWRRPEGFGVLGF